ncbi:MAG: hydantoinase/oxoprolinase family protein [Gammaproteobacteria bacterium]|nr:hydantoinase/oxoprolinase family protein [Gammaproteobacteria bacterium]
MLGSRIGIDVGGTFTDVIAVDSAGRYVTYKHTTTPKDLAHGVAEGIAGLTTKLGALQPSALLYGTTTATNALLEQRLPSIALLVTAGFREILEINGVHDEDHHEPGSGHAHHYRIVPLEHVFEVDERIAHDGTIRCELDPATIAPLAAQITAAGITVIAVCLLHSYRNPVHELRIAAQLARTHPHLQVVLSSQVLSEFREYERTVTTCLNAALLPVLQDHLERIAKLNAAPLYVMKSSGGLTALENALRTPLATVLSGPSAAVVGATHLARILDIAEAISLDIGGTSTDVALIKGGRYAVTSRAEFAGFPLKHPAVDVLSIGAGGGSIAWLGADQRWHLGPRSAGAEPGPACYGNGGTQATLTDAHLVLGRLPTTLLGGRMPLKPELALHALADFGRARGLDPIATAQGLLRIASQSMCGAIRRISVQRGHDPTSHVLFALGGGGPLHAAELAGLLGIDTVIVPPHPGFAAAYGLLTADLREDAAQTYAQTEGTLDIAGIQAEFERLEGRVLARLGTPGTALGELTLSRRLDLRYRGMSAEFSVPVAAGLLNSTTVEEALEGFHQQYEAFSGHAYRGTQVIEIVNLRVSGQILQPKPPPESRLRGSGEAIAIGRRQTYFLDAADLIDCAIYSRQKLQVGTQLEGPAIVEQDDSTILVPPTWKLTVDLYANALLKRSSATRLA